MTADLRHDHADACTSAVVCVGHRPPLIATPMCLHMHPQQLRHVHTPTAVEPANQEGTTPSCKAPR